MARSSSLRLPLIRESSANKLNSDFRGKYNLQNHVVNSCFCMTLRVLPYLRRNQGDSLNIIRRGGSSRATFRNCLLRFFSILVPGNFNLEGHVALDFDFPELRGNEIS